MARSQTPGVFVPSIGRRESISLAVVAPYPIDPTIIRNGVEAVTVYLLEGLKRVPRLRINVISMTETQPRVLERDGVTFHYLPSTKRLRNLTLDAINRSRVRRKIAAIAPDVVHVHNHLAFPYLGMSRQPQPTVSTVHGIVFEEVKYETKPGDWIRRAPRKYLERLALAHSRNLIAVSEYVRRTIQSLTHARIVVIENPVEERFFRVGEARLNTARANATRERVLFVGAINPRKNILDLLRAVTLALQAGTDLELRIAGGVQDPSYHDVLQRFVREESLQDRVRFLGQLSDTALLSEYECCALVASASHEETAGMVFQQAMAAGAPVLGTRVGGVPFVVRDGETGFLVEPGNLGQLAAALCQLVGSPELRMHLGAAGRRIALERFTTAIAATRTTALYEEMLLGAASVSASRRA